jgi:hypothetical protein
MPSIVLVRHGPVALQAPGLLSFQEFVDYCALYERSGIAPETKPPAHTIALFRNAAKVFASTAVRARQSVGVLGVEEAVFDPCFCEEPNIPPALAGRWPLTFWFAASRGRGAFYPTEAEARQAMRRRARTAAQILDAAAQQGTAALVGHGWFNRAIARALAEDGWRRVGRSPAPSFGRVAGPWGCAMFARS